MAGASHTITRVRRDTRLAVKHFKVLSGLGPVTKNLSDLLSLFHAAEIVRVLEVAQPEHLNDLAAKMSDTHQKMSEMLVSLGSIEQSAGYWRTLYSPKMAS